MKAITWSLVPLLALSLFAAGPSSVAPSPANPDLVGAITGRKVVNFNYGGHARVVEPHVYGVATTGEIVLHGYQTSHGSVSGKPPGWRTFDATEIRDLSVTTQTFAGPRADYSTERPKIDPVWAEISATPAK